MNKATKRNVLASALLSIMLCVSLIAGATYALFTSESKVNVAVTSGKVDVVASLGNLELYSPTSIDYETKTITNADNAADNENKTFKNGGTAKIDDNTLTLTNVTPGDKATVTISVKNNSNVSVRYRTILACEKDNGLFAGLNVTINENETLTKYDGATKVSKWKALEAEQGDYSFDVAIELPSTAGNEYQGKTMTLSYTVEAVQGNADTEDPDPSIYYIYTANDLVALRNIDLTQQSKIVLKNNIDMSGVKYEPWNVVIPSGISVEFEGNNKSISNLTVVGKHVEGVGFENAALFASINATPHDSTQSFIVSNLTIDKANVSNEDGASATAAAIIGATQMVNVKISDCTVKNSTIASTAYAAAFIGYGAQAQDNITTEISDCTVDNCKISGNNATGALVALSNFSVTIGGKTSITNNTLNGGDGCSAAALVGTHFANFSATDVTLANNTFAMNEGNTNYKGDHKDIGYFYCLGLYEVNGVPYTTSLEQFTAAVNGSYEKVVLAADITNEIVPLNAGQNAYTYTLKGKSLTIDLAGHTFNTPVRMFSVEEYKGVASTLTIESGKEGGMIDMTKTGGTEAYGFVVKENCTLNIKKNVTIEMNLPTRAQYQTLILNNGVVNMDGGKLIAYNTVVIASHYTAKNNGIFNMTGGEINIDASSTGIQTAGNDNPVINLTKGSITGNGVAYQRLYGGVYNVGVDFIIADTCTTSIK